MVKLQRGKVLRGLHDLWIIRNHRGRTLKLCFVAWAFGSGLDRFLEARIGGPASPVRTVAGIRNAEPVALAGLHCPLTQLVRFHFELHRLQTRCPELRANPKPKPLLDRGHRDHRRYPGRTCSVGNAVGGARMALASRVLKTPWARIQCLVNLRANFPPHGPRRRLDQRVQGKRASTAAGHFVAGSHPAPIGSIASPLKRPIQPGGPTESARLGRRDPDGEGSRRRA
jgi:hypothetical protein